MKSPIRGICGTMTHGFLPGDTLYLGGAMDGVCKRGDWELTGESDDVYYPKTWTLDCTCDECKARRALEGASPRVRAATLRGYAYTVIRNRADERVKQEELNNVYCMVEQMMCEGLIEFSPRAWRCMYAIATRTQPGRIEGFSLRHIKVKQRYKGVGK